MANDLVHIEQMVKEVIAIAGDDGIDFDLRGTTVEAIRDEEAYGGARVTVRGRLATGQIQFHVDVNVGDPLWPPPGQIQLPRVLGGPPISIRGYRVELVLAEKIVTALQRGLANTGWRDFVDIATTPAKLSRRRSARGSVLHWTKLCLTDRTDPNRFGTDPVRPQGLEPPGISGVCSFGTVRMRSIPLAQELAQCR